MAERKGTRALELWCKRIVNNYPNVNVENMTTSWRNGLAFCALIHNFRPDLIDFATLKPGDIYENNEMAFRIAEKHLGIPALLDPEDMVNSEVPDRLSILTYLSQFFQRLGNSSVTKQAVDDKHSIESSPVPVPRQSIPREAEKRFGRGDYESCTSCGSPVYLAQRLMVKHKLYHRRCFRCSKCGSQLSPGSCYESSKEDVITCDSCKNKDTLAKLLPEDDKIGMVMFEDTSQKESSPPSTITYRKTTSKQIADRISAFENLDRKSNIIERSIKNIPIDVVDSIEKSHEHRDDYSRDHLVTDNENKISNDSTNIKTSNDSTNIKTSNDSTNIKTSNDSTNITSNDSTNIKTSNDSTNIKTSNDSTNILLHDTASECSNKVNKGKLSFLQTQLHCDDNSKLCSDKNISEKSNCTNEIMADKENEIAHVKDESEFIVNLTDNMRLITLEQEKTLSNDANSSKSESPVCEEEQKIPPPRRKNIEKKDLGVKENSKQLNQSSSDNIYPDELNPFSIDEEEENVTNDCKSTNPFGSSDDEDITTTEESKSERLPEIRITKQNESSSSNPFWSDGEEPSEEETHRTEKPKETKVTSKLGRRRKAPAPPPPPVGLNSGFSTPVKNVNHDSISLCSESSQHSTVNSELNVTGSLTPRSYKKSPAPLTPDAHSIASHTSIETLDKSDESQGRRKGPAPGLPLPARRVVRPILPPDELAAELDMLEVQQQGLERQGVVLEKTIRDKCEGENAVCPPQEEVEELVIQLCELVNEKNDLFRRQAELMYIRRQQRLEQEQADIEHEIRVIQSRPAVNRIDADKAREEYLVARLVAIVKARDALVQAQDFERQRQWNEDIALAKSIAAARAKRNSNEATTSVPAANTTKKSKVKDRVKKQIKKAKISLNPKKNNEKKSGESKENVHKSSDGSPKYGKAGKAK